MSFTNPDRERIRKLLASAGLIAVVGLSDKPDRVSYQVAQAMQARGYRIVPVNPNARKILGQTSYPALRDIPEPIDIVNVFRRSEETPEVARQAVEAGAKVLWLQQGIYNEEAAKIAIRGGLEVIMDRCIKVEDAILQPRK